MALTIDPQHLAEASRQLQSPANSEVERPSENQGPSFAERLGDAVAEVNDLQEHAHQLSTEYAEGRNNDLHGTVIAMEQADISLRMVATIRNRVIEAYREVMRMGA